MPDTQHVEVLVIGSGEAGKFLAWTVAKAGRKAVLVERGVLGGACPNVACLPSKNFIYSARVASLANRGAEFGLEFQTLRIDMTQVQRRKRLMVEDQHQLHLDRTAASGAELVMGAARFIAPRTAEIALNSGGTRRIEGERVFLAVGTRASMPEIAGLADAAPMTHVEALELDRLPAHLLVIGGGYVGLELAQAMRRFGARVTVIEHEPQLAAHEDPDVGAALLELFRDEGIDVLLGTQVERVEGRSGNKVVVHTKDGRGERVVEATDLLVATGRHANTDGLGLEQTGVELDPRGYIRVDQRLRTTAPNIWAMGDCAGSPLFTHVSYDDFRVVHAQLTGGDRTTTNRLIPSCMFTDPELARVGLNETEARHAGIGYRLAKLPMSGVLRTWTVSEKRGFMKMLIAKDSDQILGFTGFGFEASELMVAAQTAMIAKLPYTALRDAILAHPTMAEGLVGLLGQVEPSPPG
ncbi:MAG TPA: FAD-dependent oxidoreductase [Candidatus Binataceae bacterium]|nr:FAD-dependent oxidoreductase [Candidatus Binataceae bacterium]